MENLDRPLLERARAADEPIAVRAFDFHIEQSRQARVAGIGQVAAVHNGNAEAVCRSLQHQRTAVDMVDGCLPCPCCGGNMVVIEAFERWQQPRRKPKTP